MQSNINANTVAQLLANTKGTTFANVVQVTKVATAAAHKAKNVQKHTVANVQLFNNVKDFVNVYTAAVQRSANKIADNVQSNVDNFVQQDNYFVHTDCFSVVQHKVDSTKFYLYAIYNNATSTYTIDNVPATKEEVAQLLTASARDKLLNASNVVHNVSNDVLHTVQVRTVALDNVVQITANKQTLVA